MILNQFPVYMLQVTAVEGDLVYSIQHHCPKHWNCPDSWKRVRAVPGGVIAGSFVCTEKKDNKSKKEKET